MRKKIGTLLIVGSLGALCAGLAACSDGNKVDEYFKDGYVITVTYDASGGEIAGGTNVTLKDMFNPDQWKADADGNVNIRPKEPTSADRPKLGADNITITHGDDTLVGWYKTRNVVKNGDGKAVDKDGNELVEQDGKYYKQSGSTLVEATPAYTYSDPFDFSKGFTYNKNDGKYDLTLYAAWTEKFTFQYYYKEVNEDGTDKDMEWTAYGSATKFDYSPKTEQKLYVPRYSSDTGKMVYRNSGFSFPSLPDMTFDSAEYVDKDTQERVKIDDSFKHQGHVDMETATAYAPDQAVYVRFKKGNYYRVSTAKQFADIGDANGHYTVTADELDFKYSIADNVVTRGDGAVAWPRALTSSEFTGSIAGEGNKAVTFKNVYAQYANTSAQYGGLFGKIKNGAVLKNITFENAIVDIAIATYSQVGSFGALAGEIESNAVIESVSISGHLRLGQIKMSAANINLVADGNMASITHNIALTVYGEQEGEVFAFYVNPDTATVNADDSVTVELISEYAADEVRQREHQYYSINN
ncbi:MAG: hypothetical protein K2L02_05005 [Clostridia bacterium]|nr:hypothetical protein [Clostridia bacterium]